jgi:hypothetical protein
MIEYSVEIQPDFLERQTKAQPIAAVAELIWNGLDADATAVTVDLEDDHFGGLRRIIVTDNGHGIPHADAPTLFRNLGGSWKKHGARTKLRNRLLHGQEGRGRFKAFALGGVVDWKTTYARDNRLFRYEISILERDIRCVRIGDEAPVKGRALAGVTVVVGELKRNFIGKVRRISAGMPHKPLGRGCEYTIIRNASTWILALGGHRFDRTGPGFVPISLLKEIKSQAPEMNCKIASWNTSRTAIINRVVPPFDNPELRRAIDAVEIGPARLPIIGVAGQFDRLVRLEFDEFEGARTDRVLPHLARRKRRTGRPATNPTLAGR